jgi:hypothetical protein
MGNETKLNAEQICYRAKGKILNFLRTFAEDCELSKDESKAYFVFRFTIRDFYGVEEIGRFTVLGAAIEDGIISEQRLHAALWHTLGQIRGMV